VREGRTSDGFEVKCSDRVGVIIRSIFQWLTNRPNRRCPPTNRSANKAASKPAQCAQKRLSATHRAWSLTILRSSKIFANLARPDGFEPPTTAFEAQCSIQLSYGRNQREVYRVHYGAARMVANRVRKRSSAELGVQDPVTT
jgi:hypothetical protein